MFGFFKAKKHVIESPVDGQLVELESVQDEVFSTKLAGDGLAIVPTSNTFVAPIAGILTKIFSTNHAFSIQTSSGLEVLVHIGLDTVNLNGEGFKRLATEGDKVSVGDPIISVDIEFIKSKGKDIMTPIVFNHEKELMLSSFNIKSIREGEMLLEVTIK